MKKPTKSGLYAVVTKNGMLTDMYYSKKWDSWNVCDHFEEMKNKIAIEAWCEIEDVKKFIKEKYNEV